MSATILLLHDNARPHSAAQTKDLITSFKWEQMDHPPYSPDLEPSDCHHFLHLKKFLGGKRFDDDDDLKGCGAEVANIAGGRILWGGYTKICAPLR